MNTGYAFKLDGKNLISWGSRLPTLALILVCCAHIPLYAKVLKETDTEKNITLVVVTFIIGGISIEGGSRFCSPSPPPATPLTR